MADPEASAPEASRPPPDSDEYDPDGWPFPKSKLEWAEPGVDIWGLIERVVLRRPAKPGL
jgi:hypothetical protein